MGDANLQADPIGQWLPSVFEHVPAGGIAAAPVAKQQERSRLGVVRMAVVLPAEGDAVARESAGVVADAQVDVAVIALEIVPAVRVDRAARGRWEIVVEGVDRFFGVGATIAIPIADQFLFFGCRC